MSRLLWCLGILWVSSVLIVGRVHAGPIELFDGAQLQPGDPSSALIQYQWGGAGFVMSHDSAKSFSLVCGSSISPDFRTDKLLSYVSGNGSVYVGGFSGLWRGDKDGCGFAPVDALKGRFIAAISGDPDDLKRMYVTTANGGDMAKNGIFANDGTSDEWTALGPQDASWIQSLHVVKTSSGKRFWETKVFPDPVDPMATMPREVVHYVARYSDDEGKTWTEHELNPITQFGAADTAASLRLIAVDPKNPDAIYGIVIRSMGADDILYSPMRGEPGSWSKIAEVTELGGFALTPDGKLYISDKDQMTKQVSVIDEPKAAPRKITDQYVIGCLRWDDAQKRMLACKQWQFGTLNLDNGMFTASYDMRCAQSYSSCPDMQKTCETQMRNAWCGTDHYASAPICASYMIPGAADFIQKYTEYDCKGDLTVPRAMTGSSGTAAVGGSGGALAAAAPAGSSAPDSAGATPNPVTGAGTGGTGGAKATTTAAEPPPAPKKSGGCSVAALGAQTAAKASWGLGMSLLGLVGLARVKRPGRRG